MSFEDGAPEPVRLAILLFVGFYYENRDLPDRTTYGTMRIAFQNLLYRRLRYRLKWCYIRALYKPRKIKRFGQKD